MVTPPQRVDDQDIVALDDAALLLKACPDLHDWPMRWRYDDSDIAPGTRIVAIFTPFLLDLLHRKPSKRTFNRHRDNLWLVGGEIIRRRRSDPDLERLPIDTLVGELIEADGGPLIYPRISESEQRAIDATCKKLHRFLSGSNPVK